MRKAPREREARSERERLYIPRVLKPERVPINDLYYGQRCVYGVIYYIYGLETERGKWF